MRDFILILVIESGTTVVIVPSDVIIDYYENNDTLLPFSIEQAK
jgi:hypothetical protein